ncbi:hypothetical protein BN7_4546 [Wickerhamomyces ciferrii]|uniref:Uncharacterized protein n=1 Tax=Wickerhamomyces ciferrii (strain ATCC 14091 / BCRC 22168 / CBS 111 / JCM 3599 / NBRC 0793 / NRRL Y-1031 F-60-10) TaxID=1206466 RepID=K0KUY3_WICCF|nr:uncharacterized protein BN7_4546 [Wickerhamomyces ciferrii]CCH44968.1 hypothetical protein BN7_4546 [Wickerhamomyces ciferrii]
MFSKLTSLFTENLNLSEMNDNPEAQREGYNRILNLTDEELIGTLCLEPATTEPQVSRIYQSYQSDRFVAALLDPRTSSEYKFNEICQIVEPQNVEYKRFAVKLKVKSHPTKALSEEDINNIKAYLDKGESGEYINILMKQDLNISDFLNYVNEVGSLKSDEEIDDDICKINSERIPRILIFVSKPEFFSCFLKLLNFYLNSLEESSSYCSRYVLIGKVIQRQDSDYMSIKGTIPHRNCVYIFRPLNLDYYKCVNDELLKSFSNSFETVDLKNPKYGDHRFYSIYDMECANDKINIKTNNNLNEKDPLPEYSIIE